MSLDDDDMAENDFVEARSILVKYVLLPRLWMIVLSIIRFAAADEDEADDRMVEKAIIG